MNDRKINTIRDLEILALSITGFSGAFIARKYNISRFRVSQILKSLRKGEKKDESKESE